MIGRNHSKRPRCNWRRHWVFDVIKEERRQEKSDGDPHRTSSSYCYIDTAFDLTQLPKKSSIKTMNETLLSYYLDASKKGFKAEDCVISDDTLWIKKSNASSFVSDILDGGSCLHEIIFTSHAVTEDCEQQKKAEILVFYQGLYLYSTIGKYLTKVAKCKEIDISKVDETHMNVHVRASAVPGPASAKRLNQMKVIERILDLLDKDFKESSIYRHRLVPMVHFLQVELDKETMTLKFSFSDNPKPYDDIHKVVADYVSELEYEAVE